MEKKPLFRKEALQAHAPKWMGEIVLINPVSFKVLGAIAVVIGIAVALVFTIGTYTRRTSAVGSIQPATGLVQVSAPQSGMLAERKVSEGSKVKKGDVLFVLVDRRQAASGGEIESRVAEQVRLKEGLISRELDQAAQQRNADLDKLNRELDALGRDLEKLRGALALQEQRLALSKDLFKRYSGLGEEGHVSQEQVETRRADVIDQETRIADLRRQIEKTEREISIRRADRVGLEARHQQQLTRLEREAATNRQDLVLTESRMGVSLTATVTGTATAILAEPGQFVEQGQPLMSIVPENSPLIAQLLAPSRSVGFVKPGTRVRMRLQAYPYQKFGQLEGKVISISRSALSTSGKGGAAGEEPVFLVRVELSRQSMTAFGREYPLQVGMLLEADLMSETRRIYEWAFEPLFGLAKRY